MSVSLPNRPTRPRTCPIIYQSSSPTYAPQGAGKLRSVTPSASGMPHVAFAVSPPQPRIRRPVIAIFRSRLRQDGMDCSEGIYDREAIKERSRGLQRLQRSGNPRNRSTSQKRILKGCQKRSDLRTFVAVVFATRWQCHAASLLRNLARNSQIQFNLTTTKDTKVTKKRDLFLSAFTFFPSCSSSLRGHYHRPEFSITFNRCLE